MLWSARWLDPDSVAAAFPYRVAPLYVRQLPGPGVPARPAREPARIADPSIHLSYAAQWFFFALVALIGPFILGRALRHRRVDP
jgi:cytochrome oxidase assembly protein ShyY1